METKPEVWTEFQSRFGIDNIVEFYGSSEGNISLFNIDSKFGAIGRIPPYLQNLMQVRIIKFDVNEEVQIRNSDGLCIECDFDEAGEAVGKIPDEMHKWQI